MIIQQLIFYQFLYDWWNQLTQPQQLIEGDIVASVAPNWLPIFTAIMFAVFAFIGIRFVILSRRRPNSEPRVGLVRFFIKQKGEMLGYVHEYNRPLSPKVLMALQKKYPVVVNELIKKRNAGELVFYQMFYKDNKRLLVESLSGRRTPVLVISTAKLNEKYLFLQDEPEHSMLTGFEEVKTVSCHHSSDVDTITTPKGSMEVWKISPEPNIPEKVIIPKVIDGEDAEEFSDTLFYRDKIRILKLKKAELAIEEIAYVVKVSPYNKEFARLVPHMERASEQMDYIEGQEELRKSQEDELKQRDEIINKQQQTINTLKLLSGQKKLVGNDIIVEAKPSDFIIWIAIGSGVSLAFSYLPTMIYQLRDIHPLFLGVIGIVATVGMYAFTRKRREISYEDYEKAEIEAGKSE